MKHCQTSDQKTENCVVLLGIFWCLQLSLQKMFRKNLKSKNKLQKKQIKTLKNKENTPFFTKTYSELKQQGKKK